MPDRPCEINARNEKYRFAGGIGVNSPGADVFLFSHLFYVGAVDVVAVLAGAAAACRAEQKSLHRADVGHCRLSIRQRYTLGSNPALDVLLNQALTGRIWFSWQMFQAVGLPNPLFGMNIEPYKPVDFFFIAMFYSAGGIASVVMLFVIFTCWAICAG